MNLKKWAGLVLFMALLGYLGYRYVYQDHRDISTEKASYTLDAGTLLQEFETDELSATEKYLNKTIAVSGKVQSIDAQGATLEPGVFVIFSSKNNDTPSEALLDQTIEVKGRCIGFDNLLLEVKIDEASLLN